MKAKLLFLTILTFVFCLCAAQVPQGFNYQAIARDGSGQPISDPMDVIIAILAADNSTVIYEEQFLAVDPNEDGLFSVVVGNGTRIAGVASFSLIDWTVSPKFIRTKIVYNGEKDLGSTKLVSVPYAMVADSLGGPLKKLSVQGSTSNMEEALFEVKNTAGKTVFAVYNEGVRVYVGDGDAKGVKGGFAVSSMAGAKAEAPNFLYVSKDSIRAYVYDDPVNKGVKGGFAVSGYNNAKKQTNDYLLISPDSVRVFIDSEPSTGKGVKGGFAVSSYGVAKATGDDFLRVTPDSTRVYVNPSPAKELKGGFAVGSFGIAKGDPVQKLLTVSEDSIRMYINDGAAGKGAKGGFAVSGFDQAKGLNTNFMTIATDNTGIIDPAENRILWYPMNDKNAFLVGRVLIQAPDSIGVNSVTTGYESRAKGAQSQAMGYQAIARGAYSTAIGKNAVAHRDNSFSFGELTTAFALNSYAFGYNSLAKGQYSFAFGQGSQALSAGSYAFGKTAIANGLNSFAFGESVTAGANNTITNAYALGKSSQAQGNSSFAFGDGAIAVTTGSYAFGKTATANGQNSFAFGESVTAGLNNTITNAYALGKSSQAQGNSSFAFGNGAISYTTGGFAFGKTAIANGSNSFAFGESVTAGLNTSTLNAYAFGYNSSATKNYAIAMGLNATASGLSSFAINGVASGDNSFAVNGSAVGAYSKSFGGTANGAYSMTSGYDVTTTSVASYGIAMGYFVEASGLSSIAIGSGKQLVTDVKVEAKGEGSISMGSSTKANAKKSISIGSSTVSSGENSVSIGTVSYASGTASVALGNFLTAGSAWSTAIGYNNYSWGSATTTTDLTDPLLMVGNGFSGSESNAFVIEKNGRVGIGMGTNKPTHLLDVRGQMRMTESGTYDVWIQGGASTSGATRNLALVGYTPTDKLMINYGGEYTGGTEINGAVSATGTLSVTGAMNFAEPFTHTLYSAPRNLMVTASGEVGGINGSSIRYKENVFNLENYDWLFSLRPVIYNYINSDPADIQYGMIAEETDKVNPLLVIYKNNQPEGIMYERLTVPMLKAIQDQKSQIESLSNENAQLRSELQELRDEVEKIRSLISTTGSKY